MVDIEIPGRYCGSNLFFLLTTKCFCNGQVLWMLELYWLKAVIAIFEVVAFEAAFVADAERRSRQLNIRNAKSPIKR